MLGFTKPWGKPRGTPSLESELMKIPGFLDLQEKYVSFCAGPYINPKEARKEFVKLCALSGIQMVAFGQGDNLLLGTTYVRLRDHRDQWHDIGEFIITIIRSPNVADIRFHNITRRLPGDAFRCGAINTFDHPHIMNGALCLPTGESEMRLAVAKGDIAPAAEFALLALHTLSEHPHGGAEINYWPLTNNGGNNAP